MASRKRLAPVPGRVVRCVVLSFDNHVPADQDVVGKKVEVAIHEFGHDVIYRRMVKNHNQEIRDAMAEALAEEGCEAIVLVGGTEVVGEDQVCDTLQCLYDRVIAGFATMYHQLAYAEVGPESVYYCPSAGIVEQHLVFSLPGLSETVQTVMERLVLPRLAALVEELAG